MSKFRGAVPEIISTVLGNAQKSKTPNNSKAVYGTGKKMNRSEFEKIVKKAVMALPKYIQEKMDNVAIVIEKRPSGYELKKVGTMIDSSLLGLYQGVPKTAWGRGFGMRLPDKITIYQDSIENLAYSPQEIAQLVKIVVWHEIAHHFGLSEKKVRQLETKWRKKKILGKESAY